MQNDNANVLVLDAHARVTRGAAWLDRIRPGWAQRIDQSRLNLASGNLCVLGQIFGDFSNGLQYLPPAHASGSSVMQASIHGMASMTGYRYLHEAWLAAIEVRLSPAVPVVKRRAELVEV